ncbi:hypothetical protein [Maribacter sp. Asnod1-A12]|uniref:hypothetical protein n=1 Tax=Maribacter sp. Asnod1-A12 TaxID=3160576 RepID=UPI0038655019
MSEIMTSVDLTHNPTEAYHFLYASQLYNTLFAVYGKFNYKEKSSSENQTITIDNIDFKLINYKGNVNIGFSDTMKDNKVYNTLHLPSNSINLGSDAIYFEVQALTGKLEATVKLFEPIVIRKGDNHNLKFNRLLVPIDGLRFDSNNKDYSLQDPKGNCYDEREGVFDSEFKYRDGLTYFDKQPQQGVYSNPLTLDILKSEELNSNIASPRCHQSNVYLVYK